MAEEKLAEAPFTEASGGGTPQRDNKLKKQMHKLQRNSSYLVMCVPVVIKTIVFSIVPMLWMVMAFQNYRKPPLFDNDWVWFQNFRTFFADGSIWRIVWNTVGLNFMFIFLGTPLTALMALFMHEMKNRALTKVFQTIWFIPYLISWSVAQYCSWGIMEDNGLINTVLLHLGWIKEPIDFYSSSKANWWPAILLLWNIWKGQGYSVILDYAALQSLDTGIMEAAELDGANRFQRMWYIEVAHLRKIVAIQLIMAMGGIVRSDFGLFWFLPKFSTNNIELGLQEAVEVLDIRIYQYTQGGLNGVQINYSLATAIGIVQSLVGMGIMLFTNWIVGKLDEESTFI